MAWTRARNGEALGGRRWAAIHRQFRSQVDALTPNARRLTPLILTAGSAAVAIIEAVVGIAQLAEHRTVAPTVAGSIPVSHPRIFLQ
jgi:hypothetical protein